jgi:hypothetical protein
MKKLTNTLLALCLALPALACDKQESPETPADEDGPMEEAGEWTDDAAEDTEDALESAAEETGDALEEAGEETDDELDGDPATD